MKGPTLDCSAPWAKSANASGVSLNPAEPEI